MYSYAGYIFSFIKALAYETIDIHYNHSTDYKFYTQYIVHQGKIHLQSVETW